MKVKSYVLTLQSAVEVVAKIAPPRLRSVLGFAGVRHLPVPQSVAHLDGRRGSAPLGILAISRSVWDVVEEPTRVGNTANFG